MLEKIDNFLRQGLLTLMLVTLVIASFPLNIAIVQAADTTPPVVTIDTPENSSIFELGVDITYTYTVIEANQSTEEVLLDSSPIPDTGTISGLGTGTYNLTVVSTDNSSNVGFDQIIFFVTDTVNPVVTITSPINASVFELGEDVTYTYNVDDLSSTSVVVRQNGFIITDTGLISAPSVGTHTLTIEATDAHNNFGSDEITFFVQDTAAPIVIITSPANASTYEYGGDVAYTYSATDLSGVTATILLDGGEVPDTGLLSTPGVGIHNLTINIVDDHNNVGSDQITFFVQDTISPVVTITSPANNSIYELGTDVAYAYTIDDQSATSVIVKLDDSPISDTGLLTSLPVGTYVLKVEADDGFNVIGYDEIFFSVVDTTAPLVTITSPSNDSYFELGSAVTYTYTTSDLSGLTVVVKLNGSPITDSGTITGLLAGTYTLTVEATDTYSNFEFDEVIFFVEDTVSPIVTIDSPVNASSFEFGSDVTYTYTVTDLSGTTVVVKLDGVPITDSGLITGLAVGTYTLTVEATDLYSNFGSDEITFFVQDTTLPVVTITSPANDSTFEFGGDISYTYTVSDLSGTTVVVKLDGVPITDSGSMTGLIVGTYTLTVEATDSFSNVGFNEIIFFVVDTTAPIVSITSPGNASIFEFGTDVSYAYTVTELSGTSVVVKLNGAPITDAGTISGLLVGSYTLTVEATDTYSNFGFDEIIFFIEDSVSPIVTVDSPVNASLFEFGSDVAYTYTVTDLSGITVVVKLDGVPVTDTGLLTGLTVGTYTLTIEATDLYSNFGSDEITFFIQDTTLPVVVITSPVNSSTFEFGNDVAYTYTVTDLSSTSVVVRLNGAPIADTGLISGLSVSTYTLVVEATDVYGNVGTAETVFFYLVDTVSPVVTITSPSNASVYEFGSDVFYTYSVSDLSGTTVVVKLNGVPISDSGSITGLAVGTYTLTVEATDLYGNFGSDEISFFVQDTTLPIITITSPANSSTFEFGGDVAYTYSVTDLSGTSVIVKLNGAPIADTGLLSGLSVGTYTLIVEATDAYGNVGIAETVFFYLVDTIPPVVTITSPSNDSTFEFGTDITYTYIVSDLSGTSVAVKLNGAPIADSGSITGLAVGTYTLTVEATDIYSNFGSDEIKFFVQDTTLPIVEITSPVNASTFEFGNDVTYTYSVTDLSGTSVVVRLNGAPIADTGLISGLSVGTYTLVVEATDAYGNVGIAETVFFYLVDTVPPVVTIISPSNGTLFEFDSDVSYTYTVSDLSSTTIVVKLDGVPVADTGILSGLTVGTYTLIVEATDLYSNFGSDEISFFLQDTTSPIVTITSPANTSTFEFGDDVSYTYTVSDLSGTSVVVKLNGAPEADSGTITGLAVGIHILTIEANDVYSNFGFDEITFFIQDTTLPVVVITSPVNSSTFEFGNDVAYTYSVTDLSGTSVVVRLNGAPITDTGLISGLSVGTYTLVVEATDVYGNVGTAETVFFYLVDTIPPVVTITSPSNDTSFEFGSDVSYTYTVSDLSGTSVVVKLNGAPIADSGLLSSLLVGPYVLTVEATDLYSNFGFDEVTFFVQDTTLPTVDITSPVNASTFEFGTDVSYTYTVTDLSSTSVIVKLNGVPVPDSGILTSLTVGTYTLIVEATDAYGNVGVAETVFFYLVDTIPPVVTITSPANDSTFEFGSDITYTYTVSDLSGTSIVVKLNGAPIADGGLLSGLAVGTHVISVEATDIYSNFGFDSVTMFVVDTTSPVIDITSPVNATYFEFGSDVNYDYSVTDLSGTSVVVRLNGAPISDSGLLTSLSVGTYTLTVEATDSYSNIGIEEVTFFMQDTISPVVLILTPSNNSIFEYGDSIGYTYSVTDLSSTTVLVRLNGAPIPDSGLLSGFPVGSYFLNVEATDAHSNVNDYEISFSIQDTISPVVTILSPANSSIFEFGDDLPYSYSVSDLSGTSVVVRLNGAPIPDTELLTALPVGNYVFSVEASDLYSNIGSDEITFFVQDTTLPVVVITSPVNASTFEFGTDVFYTYTVTDLSGTSVVVRLNGAPIADTGLISGLSVGTYTLVVEATDVYGNLGIAETIFFYLVDTISPVVTITSPSNDSSFEFGSDVSYSYTVSDLSETTVVLELNGVPIADSGLLTSLTVGMYTLYIQATDIYSNVGFDSIVFSVADTTLPVVTITSPVNASIFEFGTDVSYTYTVSDLSGTSVVVSLNSAPISDSGLISGLTVGTYTLNVETTDVYGNVGYAETTFFYLIDTTSPVVSISTPANSTTFEFGINITYDYTVFDSISVELNGVPIPDSGLLSSLPVGTYVLTVEATDVYANVGSDEVTLFVQDTIIPVVSITSPSNNSIFEFGIDVSYVYSVTDLSGTSVVVRLNGAPIADSGLLTSLAVGMYVLNVEATDAHSNAGSDEIIFSVVDTTEPIVVIVNPVNASFFEFGDDVPYTYTVTDLSGTSIIIRLDGAPIPDSGLLSGLSVGTYNLNVEATDTSNNVGDASITFFVVDTTNPVITITTPVNASIFEFGPDVTYTYTVFDLSGTSVVVSLNSVPIADAGVLSGLAVGTYTLNVEATDIYTNIGFEEITFFVVDTTAPVVAITSPVNASIFEYGSDVTYTYTVFDLSGTSIVVSLNSAPIADTGLLNGLAVGTYTLNVEVTDVYGNIGSAETTFFFLVDTTSPIITITDPTNATFFEFGDDVPYAYTVFDLSSLSIKVQLNGVDIADTGLLSGLAVGTYILYVEGTDIYNNQGSDTITFFVQDTILPVVSVTNPSNNSIFEFGDIVFYDYTVSDLSPMSVEVKLDGVVISDLGVLVNLAVGSYRLSVEATDAHSNLGLDEKILVVDDTIQPVVSINTPENETVFEFGSDIFYTYQYSDLSSVTVEVLLDGVGITNTGVISDVIVGSHLLQVRVTDSSNNIGIAEIALFVQDRTNPIIFVSSPVSEIKYPETDPIPLNTQILELANYSVTVYLNGSILAVDPYNGFIPTQEVGFHLLNITVIDASGNVEISLTMIEVYDVPVDIKVTLVSPNGGEVIASDLWTISWTLENPWKLNTSYNIYYSINQSDTWVLIEQNLTTTSYQWDTTSLVTSFVYEIKIEAMTVYNSQILISEDISDNYFTVANRKVTIEFEIPDTIPDVLPTSTPGFELPILLLGLTGLITLLRRRK
ncbi:MAG: Ig-like domain-containing protein [Candidatus Hodarchaeales archaeon]|jgi:hypothetical protein